MNIDQFISKLETSDAYRNNGEVRKLVDESRQTLIDLAHGNDGDAFKAELMKFNDRLDECLSPKAFVPISPEVEKLAEKLKLREQYSENRGTLDHFGFIDENGGVVVGDALLPTYEQVIGTFTPSQLELAATFQEPTLLLVPKTSFAAKVAAIDAHRTMEGQMETDVGSIFSVADSDSNRIAGWRAVIVNGKRDWDYDWGAEDKEMHFNEEMSRRKALLRPGEKDIDRDSYAMLMMKGIQKGDPIDQNGFTIFPDDPAVSFEYFPSGEWTQAEDEDPPGPRVGFFGQSHQFFWEGGRFRSSVGGDVLLNAVESSEASLETYTVEVDYDLSLEEAIKAGKYDHVGTDFTLDKYPSVQKGKGPVEMFFVKVEKQLVTDEVVMELEKRGLRPATVPELLALGAAKPELQRESQIMIIGSLGPEGVILIPYLGEEDGRRFLDKTWVTPDRRWDSARRFLAVRK